MQIRELSPRFDAAAMEALLRRANIRPEAGLEYACGLYEGDSLLACGGYEGSTIKCLAVDPDWRGEALLNSVFSHLYTRLRRAGAREVFVFTRPENIPLFQSLGLSLLARTAQAALLTSDPRGIESFLADIQTDAAETTAAQNRFAVGAIVMNANPFTLGHLCLAEWAAAQCGRLHIFVVQEEKSAFPFAVRLRLVREGTAGFSNARVHAGGPYIISSATFPSYFLKDPSGAAPAHAELDATLFAERIAPALGLSARFVGEEPLDPLTGLYNQNMARVLAAHAISLEILPRIAQAGAPISASRVRALLKEGRLEEAAALLPPSTAAYLRSPEGRALVESWSGA